MLRHGRLGERELLGEIAVHAPVAVGQKPYDPHPHGVPQRLGEKSELFVEEDLVRLVLQGLSYGLHGRSVAPSGSPGAASMGRNGTICGGWKDYPEAYRHPIFPEVSARGSIRQDQDCKR